VEWKNKISEGTTIPESVKKVTYDDQGRIHYKFDGWNVKMSPDLLFAEGQTGDFPFQFSEREGKVSVLAFTVDGNGDITGKVIEIDLRSTEKVE